MSEEEYWYFVDQTQTYNGKRDEAYDLIPDVQSGFLVPVLINLVIGIALTAIGALLAPKPKAPKVAQQREDAPQLKTADVTGQSRFTATQGFDSIQELASLGEVIPLVFANRQGSIGGIRVKTLLLWSQLLSMGNGQQLKVLLLLSSGSLATDPEFAGYAIGDQTLKNYTSAKVALYRRLSGGRVYESDRYPQGTLLANPVSDVFTVYDDTTDTYKTWFSGTRSTSTQTTFGVYAPMPNGGYYKLPYELLLEPIDWDFSLKADQRRKGEKIGRDWTCRQAIIAKTATTATFTITGGQEDVNAYEPWGLDDVKNSVEDIRITADDNLQIGSLYMAGTAHVTLTAISTDEIWQPGDTKTFTFSIDEPGEIPTYDALSNANQPYGMHLMRLAIATVANNRQCNITELGIKSTVWKQIAGFPNVNSQPDEETLIRYQQKNGTIQLGTVNRYHRRMSFFRLQYRVLGVDSAWLDLSGGKLFAVRGNAPQPQYNFIRIQHPLNQYEFRFVPVSGGEAFKYWYAKPIYLLNPGGLVRYFVGDKIVTFSGQTIGLSAAYTTNPDWVIGRTPPPADGKIVAISPGSTPGTVRPTYTVDNSYWTSRYDSNNAWMEGSTGTVVLWNGTRYAGAQSNLDGYQVKRGGYVGLNSYTRWYRIDYYVEQRYTAEYSPSSDGVFPLVGGSGTGGTIRVRVWHNGHREFTISSGGVDYIDGEQGSVVAFGQTHIFTLTTDAVFYVDNSLNPHDAIADWHKYDCERTSHQDGPEHEIVYVNEQITQISAPQYDDLALIGLRLNATKEWTSFQQLSAYVKKGIVIKRLIDDNGNSTTSLTGPTNNFAEIAYTLLTDDKLGAGKILGVDAVDRDRMTTAAKFCRANGFTWDGVIGQKLNLREFIFENAGYNLLDFTILGGQFSLVPSVPYAADYRIDRTAKPVIKALFTDGNIRDLQVSWLSPEERQLFKATVKYRQETENGFSQERMTQIRFTDAKGGSDNDPEEVFDLTGFCTTREHAELFAKVALELRKEVDHGLKFQTTPQAVMGLTPGEYFRLVSAVTHTSRFNNGVINDEGTIISTITLADGSYQVLTWQPGTVGVVESTLQVTNGKAQAALWGQVFTLLNSTTTSRVYKVESLTYADGGFVEIAGSYAPVNDDGTLATLDWYETDFVIERG